jgi:hypothetical protein
MADRKPQLRSPSTGPRRPGKVTPLDEGIVKSLALPTIGGGIPSLVVTSVIGVVAYFMAGIYAWLFVFGFPIVLAILGFLCTMMLRYLWSCYLAARDGQPEPALLEEGGASFASTWVYPGLALLMLFFGLFMVTGALFSACFGSFEEVSFLEWLVLHLFLAGVLYTSPAALVMLMNSRSVLALFRLPTQIQIVRRAGSDWLVPWLVGNFAMMIPLFIVQQLADDASGIVWVLLRAVGFVFCVWAYGATGAAVGWLARRNPEVRRLLES